MPGRRLIEFALWLHRKPYRARTDAAESARSDIWGAGMMGKVLKVLDCGRDQSMGKRGRATAPGLPPG